MKNLPVPVFLRPLDEKDASMKVLKMQFTTGTLLSNCNRLHCRLNMFEVCDEVYLTDGCVSVLQLWCAACVNLSGGKTRDGGSIVGASVFYSDVSGPESPKRKVGSQSSLDKLDQELRVCTHALIFIL